MDEPDQFPEGSFSSQVYDPFQLWVVMALLTDVDELDFSTEMLHHGLIARGFPPFDRKVILSARGDNPEGCRFTSEFVNL